MIALLLVSHWEIKEFKQNSYRTIFIFISVLFNGYIMATSVCLSNTSHQCEVQYQCNNYTPKHATLVNTEIILKVKIKV